MEASKWHCFQPSVLRGALKGLTLRSGGKARFHRSAICDKRKTYVCHVFFADDNASTICEITH